MKRALSFRRFRKAGHVRLHDGPMPPLLDTDGSPMPPSSPGVSEPYGSLLDSLLFEQATLTRIMKGFEQQLHAGADGESLLCSSSFQEVLARLGTAQQHGQSAALAVPSSARAPPQGAPGGSRHPGREVGPLGAQPPPYVLGPAASNVAEFTARNPPGAAAAARAAFRRAGADSA